VAQTWVAMWHPMVGLLVYAKIVSSPRIEWETFSTRLAISQRTIHQCTKGETYYIKPTCLYLKCICYEMWQKGVGDKPQPVGISYICDHKEGVRASFYKHQRMFLKNMSAKGFGAMTMIQGL
jgi:hypothetical protein